MKMVPLGRVAAINPRLGGNSGTFGAEEAAFLPMDSVSEGGFVAYQQRRRISEANGYTSFRRGDILLAKITPCMENGKAAHLQALETEYGFGSTEFHVIRPSDELDGRYAFYLIWNPRFRHLAECRMTGSAGQKRVPASFLKELEIPLPPMDEQRRIAATLDKADAIRRKHEQALALADDFLRSTFLHMFGDPVTNPKGFERLSMRDVATFISGGTPSKANPAFWQGSFPWVSPKDLKKLWIHDAQDHISEEAIHETKIKKIEGGTILIVVRGMILSHTVPIAMAGRALSINQDIKAICVNGRVCSLFLFWNLKVQHAFILSKVGTAAHGTRRLDTETIEKFPILVPKKEHQNHFCRLAASFGRIRDLMMIKLDEANALFASLSQRAFRGEL